MRLVLEVVVVLAFIMALVYWAASFLMVAERGRKREGLEPRAAEPTLRNHRDMARLLERLMHDDLVWPILPEAEQDEAMALLRDYYGRETRGLNR